MSENGAQVSVQETPKRQVKANQLAEKGGESYLRPKKNTEKQHKQKYQNKTEKPKKQLGNQKLQSKILKVVPRHIKWLQGSAVE